VPTVNSHELVGFAPAKVNLTLHVLGRRGDGYHELESLVVFADADAGDRLKFAPGARLELSVSGPTADVSGPAGDNLVLKAARLLAEGVEGLRLGRFTLDKRLPVAAGLGGGSSDAAAALRLLALENGLALSDPRVVAAARATGADVPVCLDPRPRMMRGIGEILSAQVALPKLPAVLVNPGVAVPTAGVFRALEAPPLVPGARQDDPIAAEADLNDVVAAIAARRNDLEAPAISLQPVIADVLSALRAFPACRLARMSGSGATCFGLFNSGADAEAAARSLSVKQPAWWVRATMFG
jgi:4-diphosphocytidyl-2-C-methyl-D-erythritol kinase